MSDFEAVHIDDLVNEAFSLPHGDMRVVLLQEAVRQADTLRDLDAMFAVRMELIESAIFAGHIPTAITAFAWCLGQFRADHERFEEFHPTLLWYFKGVLQNADEVPQISREQFESLLAQMADLYREYGFVMRPIHYIRLTFAIRTGDFETAAREYAQYRSIERDEMADCSGCEADTDLEYFETIDEPQQAIDAAQAIIDGRERCGEVPHRSFSTLLRPLVQLGRLEEANQYQDRGYGLVRKNPKFLFAIGQQLAYLAHRGNLKPAVRMLERHLSWALEANSLRSRYMFDVAARRVLAALAETDSHKKLKLPQQFPAYDDSGNYELTKLIAWFDERIATLGQQFNQRNGNDYFTKGLVSRLSY